MNDDRFAKRRRQQRLYMEAHCWVASDDRQWPYAFCNVADMLNVAPERLRARLLGDGLPADEGGAEVDQAA